MKRCTRCGVTKPLDAFSAHPLRSDGKQSWCKACRRAWVAERRSQPGGRDQGRATVRARNRAMEALARLHPEEFEALLTRERVAEGLSPIPYERSGRAS